MRQKRKTFVTVIIFSILIVFAAVYFGKTEIPKKIHYQGRITDSSGAPIDDALEITFSLYDGETTTSVLWSETQTVQVDKGIYNVELGKKNPLNLAFDVPYFLGVKVTGETEMTPRRALTSQAYTLRADIADTVKDGSITAAKIGENCPEGEALIMGPSGWACGKCPCPSGQINCSGKCVDTNTDEDHCGECHRLCGPGQVCLMADCALSCPPGLTNCEGSCVDTDTDESFCGDCGTTCTMDTVCVYGACECPGGLYQCGPFCVDINNNPQYCGPECYDCTSWVMGDIPMVCRSGMCMCPSGTIWCGDYCVDADTTENYCGDCWTHCQPDEKCTNGICVPCP
jgi:hypothetical protein